MKRIAHGLCITLMAAACAATEDPEESCGECAQRSGTYTATYFERTGTCGPIPEQMVTIDAQPTEPPAPCTSGQILYSGDNCEVTNVDIACPEDGIGPGVTSIVNGKYAWSCDATSGDGTMTVVVRDADAQIICQSSYDVNVTRL